MASLLIDLLIHSAIFLFGWSSSLALLKARSWPSAVSMGYPVGMGLLSWLLFLLSWAGFALTQASILTVLGLLTIAGLALLTIRRRLEPAEASAGQPIEGWARFASSAGAVSIGLLVILGAYFAVARSYSAWDGMAIWAAKGYGIALRGSVFGGQEWGAFGLTYPLNLPLMIASFRIVDGDVVPGSKLGFAFFYGSLLFAIVAFLRRRKVTRPLAVWGAVMIGTTPLVFDQGTNGYANLPFAVYLIGAVLSTLVGVLEGEPGLQTLAGLLFGLAIWTRPEGILVGPVLMAALALALRKTTGGHLRWIRWALPTMCLAVPWLVFSISYGRGSLMLDTAALAARVLAGGQFHLDAFPVIVRFMGHQFLSPAVWGLLPPVWVVFALLTGFKFPRFPAGDVLGLLVSTLVVAFLTTLHFYSTAFLGALEEWLPTSANRMFLAAGILMTITLLLAMGRTTDGGLVEGGEVSGSGQGR